MQLPRQTLLAIWGTFTLAAYWLLLFTNVGNYFHGGTPIESAMLNAVMVLASFSSLEVFHSEDNSTLRVLSVFFGLPLAIGALISVWHAIRYYVAV